MNIPKDLTALLESMVKDFPELLKHNLVGIYAWGSLTYKEFDENCSDADLIVVTKRVVDDQEFAALRDWFKEASKRNPWTHRLDVRFVIDNEFLDKTSQCCGFYFGEFARHGSDGNPIIWLNIRESGITLWGKQAKQIVPEISDRCINDALLLELDYLKQELAKNAGDRSDKAFRHNAYAVLTVCRILYTARHGVLVSKAEAHSWALETLPAAWRRIVNTAKSNRLKNEGATTAKLEREAMDFVRFAEQEIGGLLKAVSNQKKGEPNEVSDP